MSIYIPYLMPFLLLVSFVLMVVISSAIKTGSQKPTVTWILLLGMLGILAVLRGYQFITELTPIFMYGVATVASYIVSAWAAYFKYKDPVKQYKGDLRELTRKKDVIYIIPVFNESGFIERCIRSIIAAAKVVSQFANVRIVVVNDGSTDDTWERLQAFAKLPGVYLMNLSVNVGKKGAITAGTYGGENWRDAFALFKRRYKRKPGKEDHILILECLRTVGCNPSYADIILHTDSDSTVSPEFILYMIKGFEWDKLLGAISGHCSVWLEQGKKVLFLTAMQVAWYDLQFRIFKAAESAYDSVFCVSGPGAGFRAEAIMHLMPEWVDDVFGGKIYRGATDRMLTLLVLMDGWKVQYSEAAQVWTVVPDTWDEIRRQWTRWKQNFWRMFMKVWKYAWKRHPVVAYLTYTSLITTAIAPFLLAYHAVLFMLGDYINSLLYLSGIALLGSLMGIAFLIRNQDPEGERYARMRPVSSLVSSLFGSMLTLRALWLSYLGTFTWREGKTVRKAKRWWPYSWMGFDPTFETNFIFALLIIALIIHLIRLFL